MPNVTILVKKFLTVILNFTPVVRVITFYYLQLEGHPYCTAYKLANLYNRAFLSSGIKLTCQVCTSRSKLERA